MIHKAKIKGTEKWVEGYYYTDQVDRAGYCSIDIHIIRDDLHQDHEIDPTTLQVQLTNGEWCNVDDVEVVRKEK